METIFENRLPLAAQKLFELLIFAICHCLSTEAKIQMRHFAAAIFVLLSALDVVMTAPAPVALPAPTPVLLLDHGPLESD